MRKDGCADDQPRWFRGTGRTSCGHLFFKGNRFVSVSTRVWEPHTLIVNNIFVFVFVSSVSALICYMALSKYLFIWTLFSKSVKYKSWVM